MKDLGAGGVLCATVELVCGARLWSKNICGFIHVAEKSLPAAVICVRKHKNVSVLPFRQISLFFLNTLYRWDFPNVSEGARASVIGKVVPNGIYRAIYQQEEVCHAKALDITKGISVDRPVSPPHHHFFLPFIFPGNNRLEYILRLLLASGKRAITTFTETYDQTVQGNTLLTVTKQKRFLFHLRLSRTLSPKEQEIPALVSVASPARVGKLCPKKGKWQFRKQF